jgi:hypothetical protein
LGNWARCSGIRFQTRKSASTPKSWRATNRQIDATAYSRFVPTMSMTLEQIVEETRKLPPKQVSELIERISLAAHDPVDPAVEQAWTDTALRRLAEMESGKVKPIPGHITSERIRKIVGR